MARAMAEGFLVAGVVVGGLGALVGMVGHPLDPVAGALSQGLRSFIGGGVVGAVVAGVFRLLRERRKNA